MRTTIELLTEWASLEPSRCRVTPASPVAFVYLDGQMLPLNPFQGRDPQLVGSEQTILERAIWLAIQGKPDLTANVTVALGRGVRSFYEASITVDDVTCHASATDRHDALLAAYLQFLYLLVNQPISMSAVLEDGAELQEVVD